MTRDELLELLDNCQYGEDQAADHVRADEALLEFINDDEVTKAFEAIPKWYA